jgi:tRNA(Arg) A34 adenosine deaminase TadA
LRELSDPERAQIFKHLRQAQQVAVCACKSGHHPFGCILVAPDGKTVLGEQGNLDIVNHAESTLLRLSRAKYSPEFLWECTLYSTVEPCCMCAGTLYWANVGRLAYAVSEVQLLGLTGRNKLNPTLAVPCRYIFEHGQKEIKVFGPFAELESEVLSLHREFWGGSRI